MSGLGNNTGGEDSWTESATGAGVPGMLRLLPVSDDWNRSQSTSHGLVRPDINEEVFSVLCSFFASISRQSSMIRWSDFLNVRAGRLESGAASILQRDGMRGPNHDGANNNEKSVRFALGSRPDVCSNPLLPCFKISSRSCLNKTPIKPGPFAAVSAVAGCPSASSKVFDYSWAQNFSR